MYFFNPRCYGTSFPVLIFDVSLLQVLEALEHRTLLVPQSSSSMACPSSKPGAMTQPCIAGWRQWRIRTVTARYGFKQQ
jgi:hypothetical protein